MTTTTDEYRTTRKIALLVTASVLILAIIMVGLAIFLG